LKFDINLGKLSLALEILTSDCGKLIYELSSGGPRHNIFTSCAVAHVDNSTRRRMAEANETKREGVECRYSMENTKGSLATLGPLYNMPTIQVTHQICALASSRGCYGDYQKKTGQNGKV